MNKRVRAIGFLAFILAISSHAAAQDLPVVAVYTLSSSDVGDHIAKTVNDLVFSFVRELRTYRVMDMRSESLPRDLGAPDGTDYIFFGTMTDQPDGIKLELVLKGGPLGVTRLLSRVYENSNRILLESRMLVRDLFDQSVQLPEPSIRMADAAPASAPQGLQPENLKPVGNIDSLAGSWKGEDGIERIMILRGGRGVAVLSSGVSIPLEIITSGEDLVVRQKGSANPRQFADLPDPVAKQAAAIAPPLEWRFLITDDQQTLSGKKKDVRIKNDGKNVLSMDSREFTVSWTRF
jgi:hypothetical protein